jgi:hypothetical protein
MGAGGQGLIAVYSHTQCIFLNVDPAMIADAGMTEEALHKSE